MGWGKIAYVSMAKSANTASRASGRASREADKAGGQLAVWSYLLGGPVSDKTRRYFEGPGTDHYRKLERAATDASSRILAGSHDADDVAVYLNWKAASSRAVETKANYENLLRHWNAGGTINVRVTPGGMIKLTVAAPSVDMGTLRRELDGDGARPVAVVDGRQWTEQSAAASGQRPASSHRWWVWSPAYTLGLFAFIPALHAAIRLQRRDLWLWASGLIAGDLVVWGLLGGTPTQPGGSNTPIENAAAFLALVLAAVGTIHAFRVRDEVFGQRLSGKAAADTSAGLDPAIVNSLAARKRRAESAALSMKDPSLARDLRIGRPDLAREYDDGGLIDVNHVSEEFLVSHLGLSPEQARSVVMARDHVGGFQSVTELCGLADLPPRTLDEIRDRVVTL